MPRSPRPACKAHKLRVTYTRPARMLWLRRWEWYCLACGERYREPRPLRAKLITLSTRRGKNRRKYIRSHRRA